MSFSIVVLISGNGSNLQAIIDAKNNGLLPIEIDAVISSNPSAYGLTRAKNSSIPIHTLAPNEFDDRTAYDEALYQCIESYQPDLIILAGFMRILGNRFLETFKDRIINIHPSLLPKYPGLNTHEQVIAAKDLEHGCTIHFVTDNLDGGPIIAQVSIKVDDTDTASTLKEKVHQAEHFLYPVILNWFRKSRIKVKENKVEIDGIIIPNTGLQFILFNSPLGFPQATHKKSLSL